MKTIQDLIRYDTDKATEIVRLEDTNKNNPIILYTTENKNWFTYQDIHNSFIFLSEREAALMLERYSKFDLLEEHFGHLLKDA
jgi:hypothetical protein